MFNKIKVSEHNKITNELHKKISELELQLSNNTRIRKLSPEVKQKLENMASLILNEGSYKRNVHYLNNKELSMILTHTGHSLKVELHYDTLVILTSEVPLANLKR